MTNSCVETAVRDAGDRGYNVVLVSDACAAMSEERKWLDQSSLMAAG
ncbi:isochorismatase family protein [Mesorhizobium abyssinicae]|nr:isochorismatase family protein [Mesorhizobium abyssinicae]MDX8437248.1 isochorismatase family protein [Mesorhizobium abyssinicae]